MDEQCKQMCYIGVSPVEHGEMTFKEARMLLEGYGKRKRDQYKDQAILLDGLARQLSSVFAGKHSKHLALKKLYPGLFAEDKGNIAPTQEQRRMLEVIRWKDFLGK